MVWRLRILVDVRNNDNVCDQHAELLQDFGLWLEAKRREEIDFNWFYHCLDG